MAVQRRQFRSFKGLGRILVFFVIRLSPPGGGAAWRGEPAALPARSLVGRILQGFCQLGRCRIKAGRSLRHGAGVDGLGDILHKGGCARFRRRRAQILGKPALRLRGCPQVLGEPGMLRGGRSISPQVLGKAGMTGSGQGSPTQILRKAGMFRGSRSTTGQILSEPGNGQVPPASAGFSPSRYPPAGPPHRVPGG